MSIKIKIDTLDGDRKVATLNGKSYTLLRGYKSGRWGDWLFLALAGRVPLKASDLDDHWKVIRASDTYLAFSERHFAYHLMAGEGAPVPDKWPKLKAEPDKYCFVGLTDGAALRLAEIALAEYRPDKDLDTVKTTPVKDVCGGPDGILLTV